jgi:hypothetical protein
MTAQFKEEMSHEDTRLLRPPEMRHRTTTSSLASEMDEEKGFCASE